MDLAKVVKMVMARKAIKQKELVDATGINKSSLNRAVNGDYSGIKYLNSIFTALYPSLREVDLVNMLELLEGISNPDGDQSEDV